MRAPWTEYHDDQLRAGVAEGLSFCDIALRIGAHSRKSCINRYCRLKAKGQA